MSLQVSRKLMGTILASLGFFIIAVVSLPSHASAAYIGNELIDDPIFLNASSMSASQIQSFLAGKNSYLTNYTTTENLSYYPNYNKTVPASQAIYDAGQVYGINPQVILATLQKEESLVTDPSPSQSQLQFAMGYGCPDSNGCGSGSAGFFYQIDNGTWDLRFMFERARGNNSWWNPNLSYQCGTRSQAPPYNYPSNNNPYFYYPSLYPNQGVTFYDGYGTAYASFTIANASTASLYCYTPHAYPGSSRDYYSGSYNFVVSFESWFGPTGATLLLQGSGPGVYLVYNGTKYAIPYGGILSEYGLQSQHVTPTSDSYLSSLNDGGVLTNAFMISGQPAVFLADSGKRYGIPSQAACTNWAIDCTHNVATLDPALVSSIMQDNGTLQLLMSYGGTLYLMDNGKKDPFLTLNAASEHGYNAWTTVANADNANQPYGVSYPQNASLVKFGGAAAIFYYSNNSFYYLPSFDTYKSWFTPQDNIYIDSISTYNVTPPTVAGPVPTLLTYSGTKYLVDQNRKLDLSAVTANWPAASDGSFMATALGKLPTVSVTSSNSFANQAGAIFQVSNNQIRTYHSWYDFTATSSPQNVIKILTNSTAGISVGPDVLAPGRVVAQPNSSAIVMLAPNNTGYWFGSMKDINNFNIAASSITSVNQQTFSFYATTVKPLLHIVKDQSGNVSIITYDNKRIPASSSLLQQWGLDASSAPILENTSINNVPSINNSGTFASSSNGTIYYASGGQKHPISSYQKYLQLGGNSSNTFAASNDFLDASPTGSVD